MLNITKYVTSKDISTLFQLRESQKTRAKQTQRKLNIEKDNQCMAKEFLSWECNSDLVFKNRKWYPSQRRGRIFFQCLQAKICEHLNTISQ